MELIQQQHTDTETEHSQQSHHKQPKSTRRAQSNKDLGQMFLAREVGGNNDASFLNIPRSPWCYRLFLINCAKAVFSQAR